MFFKFLWSSKKEKVKRTTLIGNKLQGGLEITDLETYSKALILKWIKNLVDNQTQANWKVIPNFFLSQFGQNYLIFDMQLDSYRSLPNTRYNIPAFYKHLIESYICFNKTKQTQEPKTYYDIRKQIIWGNQNIKLNGKCLESSTILLNQTFYISMILLMILVK